MYNPYIEINVTHDLDKEFQGLSLEQLIEEKIFYDEKCEESYGYLPYNYYLRRFEYLKDKIKSLEENGTE